MNKYSRYVEILIKIPKLEAMEKNQYHEIEQSIDET